MFGFSQFEIIALVALALVSLFGPIGSFLVAIVMAASICIVAIFCCCIDHVVTLFSRRTGARRPK